MEGTIDSISRESIRRLTSCSREPATDLVHAVTGAGKTEMIYKVVAKVINDGGAVCLASPRIDVCLELYSDCRMTLLAK